VGFAPEEAHPRFSARQDAAVCATSSRDAAASDAQNARGWHGDVLSVGRTLPTMPVPDAHWLQEHRRLWSETLQRSVLYATNG
jgi:hypothetical protein